MKPSPILAVLLSASIPGGAFAQTVRAGRLPASPTTGASSPYGSTAVMLPPLSLALSLSAPSIAPALTPVPGIVPRALPAAILSAPASGAVPVLPAALAVVVHPAAAVPLTPASIQIEKMTEDVAAFFEAAEPADKASSESSQDLASKVFGALTGGQASAAAIPAGVPAAPVPNGNLTQQKMIRTLYQVAAVFAEQYAPIDWKKELFTVDLKREYDKALHEESKKCFFLFLRNRKKIRRSEKKEPFFP